jgi:hypothetical protein
LLFYRFLIFIKQEVIVAVSTVCTLVENISELHLLLQIKTWGGHPGYREGKEDHQVLAHAERTQSYFALSDVKL